MLIDHAKPPLVLSKLEGDAVFSYTSGDAFQHGQMFVELIENTYVAFRRAIELMVMNKHLPVRSLRQRVVTRRDRSRRPSKPTHAPVRLRHHA